MNDVVALVMAGGTGERLKPLTDSRAKPAVPFGGVYRIIDFTLANCVNSQVTRIFVLTQHKSHSLSTHLKECWSLFSRRLGQHIDEIPAQAIVPCRISAQGRAFFGPRSMRWPPPCSGPCIFPSRLGLNRPSTTNISPWDSPKARRS